MTHITNISRELAEHILGQYAMTHDQISYALDFAAEYQVFEGEHNGYPIKITSDRSRYTITRGGTYLENLYGMPHAELVRRGIVSDGTRQPEPRGTMRDGVSGIQA